MTLDNMYAGAIDGSSRIAGDLVDFSMGLFQAGAAIFAETIPKFPELLSHTIEISVLCLGVMVLALFRRMRRDRAAMRGMAAELESQRALLADFERRHNAAHEHVVRLRTQMSDLGGRQRSLEARAGKPDTKLAAAMARAGTRRQHMVDCGLSHSEVHLLNALSARKKVPPRTAMAGETQPMASGT